MHHVTMKPAGKASIGGLIFDHLIKKIADHLYLVTFARPAQCDLIVCPVTQALEGGSLENLVLEKAIRGLLTVQSRDHLACAADNRVGIALVSNARKESALREWATLEFPPTVPAYDRLLVDARDHVWVRRLPRRIGADA